MKLLIHLIVFAAGAGLGIWWGVNHPNEAATIAQREQTEAAKIRLQVLQQLDDSPKARQMLADEQKKISGN
ncbi:MAG: hypothetical protein M3O30_11400 [Planctomycetota bacterium]|nr:hypothetical protein [Planctomycetota bacterium]